MRFLRKERRFAFQIVLAFYLFITGCSTALPSPAEPTLAIAETVSIPSTAITIPTNPSTPSDALSARSVYLPPYLPAAFREQVHLPSGWEESETADTSDVRLEAVSEETSRVVSRWIFAAAAPFPTVDDSITLAGLIAAWRGDKLQDFFPTSILIDPETASLFTTLWGAPDLSYVKILPENDLLGEAWKEGTVLAIIPFEKIEPKWKILEVDGQNPVHKNFQPNDYPLTVRFILSADENVEGDLVKELSQAFPASNRDPAKLTTVILTGVTALVRGTADLMERNGMDYPAGDIGPILREADITHISNEIPFTSLCPLPFMREDNLVFCSKPEYIQLLEAVGADVIELSGDHFKDWGADAVTSTIHMYIDRGWKYYGGGFNLEDGRKALQLEVNGNKIAFIGCNAKDPGYSGATVDQPGAVHCDFDWLQKEIARVKAEGYLPIVTFQHLEFDSIYPNARMQTDFQQVSFDGAAIVSGSQAHQPMAMEFFRGSFIHFGLGNLFFDQYKESLSKRQAFIDRHVIYDNRYINTELITIQFIDLAKPRLMNEAERRGLLNAVFKASAWK